MWVAHINGACNCTFFVAAPWGPSEGSKGQILYFNFKVNFKDFLIKLCLFHTHERYKTYQMGFSFGRLGHAPGVVLGGTMGGWGSFFPEIQPDLVCELLTWMANAPAGTILWVPTPWGLGEGPKGKISLKIWITKSISKFFKPNFVCLLANERYITYQTGFSFHLQGHGQGGDLGVPLGGVKKCCCFFPKFNQIWCVSYSHEWHMHQHNFLCVPAPWGLG